MEDTLQIVGWAQSLVLSRMSQKISSARFIREYLSSASTQSFSPFPGRQQRYRPSFSLIKFSNNYTFYFHITFLLWALKDKNTLSLYCSNPDLSTKRTVIFESHSILLPDPCCVCMCIYMYICVYTSVYTGIYHVSP